MPDLHGERPRRMKAFTLIELMIVIAIIATIAAIAIPNLLRSRIAANETVTIGNLKTISNAQQQFQFATAVDQNGNGLGEFGFLTELAGRLTLRGGLQTLTPPGITENLGITNANSEAIRTGYFYVLWLSEALVGSTNKGTTATLGSTTEGVRIQELHWCAYAWPQDYGGTGGRVFFVDEEAHVHQAIDSDYDGSGSVPSTEANLAYTGTVFESRMASGATGNDGNTWSGVR